MLFKIGTDLDKKDLTIVKSILTLRPEEWHWMDKPQGTDLWISTVQNDFGPIIEKTHLVPCIILITALSAPKKLSKRYYLIAPPIRPRKLHTLIDEITLQIPRRRQTLKTRERKISSQPPISQAPSQSSAEHPWRGRHVGFKGKLNFSRFPVTAELAVWLEIMQQQVVSYDEMVDSLPIDGELLESVLNAAAKKGQLVDEQGRVLPECTTRPSLFGRKLPRWI